MYGTLAGPGASPCIFLIDESADGVMLGGGGMCKLTVLIGMVRHVHNVCCPLRPRIAACG